MSRNSGPQTPGRGEEGRGDGRQESASRRGRVETRAAVRTCHVLSGYAAARLQRIMDAISLSFMQSRRDDSAKATARSIISFCIAPMLTTAGPTRKRGGIVPARHTLSVLRCGGRAGEGRARQGVQRIRWKIPSRLSSSQLPFSLYPPLTRCDDSHRLSFEDECRPGLIIEFESLAVNVSAAELRERWRRAPQRVRSCGGASIVKRVVVPDGCAGCELCGARERDRAAASRRGLGRRHGASCVRVRDDAVVIRRATIIRGGRAIPVHYGGSGSTRKQRRGSKRRVHRRLHGAQGRGGRRRRCGRSCCRCPRGRVWSRDEHDVRACAWRRHVLAVLRAARRAARGRSRRDVGVVIAAVCVGRGSGRRATSPLRDGGSVSDDRVGVGAPGRSCAVGVCFGSWRAAVGGANELDAKVLPDDHGRVLVWRGGRVGRGRGARPRSPAGGGAGGACGTPG
jgi:hypothetical protein